MRKGLTQALMAVAVVTMAIQAMAMAPTIGEIPSPIVGDLQNATDTNFFVYPDAINLASFVTDVETTDSTQIVWSYEVISGNQSVQSHYSINGAAALAGAESQILPPAAKIIAGPGAVDTDTSQSDSNPNTITIRNTVLSPIGGPNSTNESVTGILPAETQAVTFYASDGTTRSFKSVMFYTANNEADRFSSSGINVYTQGFTDGATHNWRFGQNGGSLTSANGATGLCMTTAAAGNNVGVWTGWYGMLPLVANNAYRIRAILNGSMSSGQCPFYDIIVNNFGLDQSSALKGMNAYGANFFFFDNVSTQNAAVAGVDKQIDVWWCPSAVSTAQWNDTSDTQAGPFGPSNAGNKDAFVEWRILDSEANSGIHAGQALGTLCLKSLAIDRFDLSGLQTVQANVFNPPITGHSPAQAGDVFHGEAGSASVAIASGTATVTPSGQGAFVQFLPGDTIVDFSYQVETQFIDDYPVVPDAQTLYLVSTDLSGPEATTEGHPMDQMWVGADTLTNDLIQLSYVTVNGWHHGMPKATTSTYKALFNSSYGTASANPTWFNRFRPRFMAANSTNLGGGETNTDAIVIHNMKVDKVKFN